MIDGFIVTCPCCKKTLELQFDSSIISVGVLDEA